MDTTFVSNDSSDKSIEVLHIKSGEVRTLPARTYKFSKIEIESGGVLKVQDNSRQWLILHCVGDFNLHGKVIFRNFYSTRQPIQSISPDGQVLIHQFVMSNLGGDGGDGSHKGIGNRGGLGAYGTDVYGGGGGGGGFNGGRGGGLTPGGDATTWRGGNSGGHRPLGDGGNGALRLQFGNGGLIYIYVGGVFDGTGGEVDLSGSNGPMGTNGGGGTGGGATGTGAAGGGGGAPGGEGGYLSLKASRISGDLLTVNVSAGIGGAGGAIRATKGQDGLTGFIDYL